jgi:hypothetical protein
MKNIIDIVIDRIDILIGIAVITLIGLILFSTFLTTHRKQLCLANGYPDYKVGYCVKGNEIISIDSFK